MSLWQRAGKGVLVSCLMGMGVLMVAGCRIHTEKSANGEDKNVQVDTPFGGLHVKENQTTASDLGLAVYPGAQMISDDDEHKSADVHMGFGQWQLRVKVVSYQTADAQAKVMDFYRKALAQYGDVIVCDGSKAVGTPALTRDGLGCRDDQGKSSTVQVNGRDIRDGLRLKAGSPHHQHIMAVDKDSTADKTKFSLVALDLPLGLSGDDNKD